MHKSLAKLRHYLEKINCSLLMLTMFPLHLVPYLFCYLEFCLFAVTIPVSFEQYFSNWLTEWQEKNWGEHRRGLLHVKGDGQPAYFMPHTWSITSSTRAMRCLSGTSLSMRRKALNSHDIFGRKTGIHWLILPKCNHYCTTNGLQHKLNR